jgi:lia operon protein LiaF
MVEQTKNNRNRNTAFVLIGAGLFLLLYHTIGFFPILAAVLMLLGIHKIRSHADRKGYIWVVIGAVILLGHNFSLVVAIVLISLGFFYLKSRQVHADDTYEQKQKLIDSIRLGKEPWILKDSSVWYLIGETHIDLSMAILEKKETTLILQGVLGDIDIIVPEDIGVSVQAAVVFGQIDVGAHKEAGLMNKLLWQSPHYDQRDHQMKLIISFIVGDIDIKIL